MYQPTTRVLTVLELLQSHQRMSGRELAMRLEVDTRTVRRYIVMLQDLGIPIEAERGRYGAYRLRPGFKLPPLMFTEDEALALTLGLLTARRFGLALAAPAVEGALAKVERVLPDALRERIQALQETLIIDVPGPAETPDSGLVVLFSAAIRQSRRLWLRYRSARAEETERELEPYDMIYREGRWYVVGFCCLRRDWRVFRLDRVLQAELTTIGFTRPAGFDSLEHLLRSFETMPGAWPVEVLLQTTLEQARCELPTGFATLEPVSDGVLLRCHVESLDWLARLLASLGCPLVVLHPPELRDALLRHAAAIARYAHESQPLAHATATSGAGV